MSDIAFAVVSGVVTYKAPPRASLISKFPPFSNSAEGKLGLKLGASSPSPGISSKPIVSQLSYSNSGKAAYKSGFIEEPNKPPKAFW